MNKIIPIGLDGMDFEYLSNNSSQFNFLNSIITKGFLAPLKSSILPTTFPAWTSLMSGFNPKRTGSIGLKFFKQFCKGSWFGTFSFLQYNKKHDQIV